MNQLVWKPETHTNCSSLFVVFNYKNIPVACQFCCGVNRQVKGPSLPSKTRKTRILHTSIQSVLILTFSPHLLWSWIYNCIPDACPIHSRYMTWKLVEDTTCMKLDSLWWLDAWAWPDFNESWTCGRCSGVMWPMNCFGRSQCHSIYTTQEVRDHRTGQPRNQ